MAVVQFERARTADKWVSPHLDAIPITGEGAVGSADRPAKYTHAGGDGTRPGDDGASQRQRAQTRNRDACRSSADPAVADGCDRTLGGRRVTCNRKTRCIAGNDAVTANVGGAGIQRHTNGAPGCLYGGAGEIQG
ncbi:hypothetical protein D3C87_1429140 [compost metagenome]